MDIVDLEKPSSLENERSLDFQIYTQFDEFLSLVPLAKRLLSESRFSHSVFSESKFEALAKVAERQPKIHGVLVARFASKPIGIIYCTAGVLAIADGPPIATVNVFYVEKALRETLLGGRIGTSLLAGLESWSTSRGCAEVLFHVNFGTQSERVHRFLKKRGYSTVGGSYAKTIA